MYGGYDYPKILFVCFLALPSLRHRLILIIILKQGKFVISTVLPLVCILNAKQPRLCGILLIFYFKYPLNYNIIDIASTLIILMLTIRMRV